MSRKPALASACLAALLLALAAALWWQPAWGISRVWFATKSQDSS